MKQPREADPAARKLGPTPARDVLKECQTRVEAIGLIHEKLYESADHARDIALKRVPEDRVRLTVADNGIGMRESDSDERRD